MKLSPLRTPQSIDLGLNHGLTLTAFNSTSTIPVDTDELLCVPSGTMCAWRQFSVLMKTKGDFHVSNMAIYTLHNCLFINSSGINSSGCLKVLTTFVNSVF